MTIEYLHGDVTRPQTDAPFVIPHVCNNIGRWGAGFTKALDGCWWEPKANYLGWKIDGYTTNEGLEVPFELGQTQFVEVDGGYVANMIAQVGVRGRGNPKPIRYAALMSCLWQVFGFVESHNLEVHAPKFGSVLAGGDWGKIESMIDFVFDPTNVYVYEYP